MTDIFEYYRRYDESTRLTRDRLHRSEYLVMIHLLDRYLSPPPLTILDCCAGCGIYSFPLARKGYTVTAGDLIPAHADYLRKHGKALCDVYRGSVCDLSRFPDECFDVVLNFGAMYHLQEEAARRTALRECLRVLRPGGRLVVISFHSLEDRIVKRFMAQHSRAPVDRRAPFAPPPPVLLRQCARVRPGAEEVAANARARSAIMRVAERTHEELR